MVPGADPSLSDVYAAMEPVQYTGPGDWVIHDPSRYCTVQVQVQYGTQDLGTGSYMTPSGTVQFSFRYRCMCRYMYIVHEHVQVQVQLQLEVHVQVAGTDRNSSRHRYKLSSGQTYTNITCSLGKLQY